MYSNYPELWRSMLDDIKAARSSVKFEQYIFTDLKEGSIGKKFIETFKEKAREGIKVKVLLDALGSHFLALSDELPEMNKAGVEVMFHTASSHKLRNFYLFKSFFRDHRKLMIIDGHIAHIGGGIVQDKAKDWGELNVRFIDQEVVKNLEHAFDLAWENLKEGSFVVAKPATDSDGFEVSGSGPAPSEHYILKSWKEALRGAKKYIRIATPYFVPTHDLLREMIRATKRGVGLEIILPESIDNIFAKFASYDYYAGLMKKGVNIKLYKGYNHAKAIVVDGMWCSVGSTNTDRMSLVHNYELNVSSTDKDFIKDIENCFEIYLSNSYVLTPDIWKNRPLVTKILEKLSFAVRPWA